MTNVRRRQLSRQLERREPASGLARKVGADGAGGEGRLDADGLDAEVRSYERLGHPLSDAESRLVRSAQRILQAPNLFDLPAQAGEKLAEKAKETVKRVRQWLWGTPPFTSPTAPRVAQPRRKLVAHEEWSLQATDFVTSMPLVSPDQQTVFVAERMGMLRFCDLETGREKGSVDVGLKWVSQPVLSPDGRTLFMTGGEGGTGVVAVDTQTRQVRWRMDTEKAPSATSCTIPCPPALSADGRFLYVPCLNGEVIRFDAETGAELGRKAVGYTIAAHTKTALLTPDGKRLLVRAPRTLYALDTETLTPAWTLDVSQHGTEPGSLSPDGKTLYLGGHGRLDAFHMHDGSLKWSKQRGVAGYNPAPLTTPDGRTLVLPSHSGRLFLLDAETGGLEAELQHPEGGTFDGQPAFDAKGLTAWIPDSNGRYVEIDLLTEEVRMLEVTPGRALGFSLSPDTRFAYQGSLQEMTFKAVPLE